MPFQHTKSATYRLSQAHQAGRARAAEHLARIGLQPGQELALKALATDDGLTMSTLAAQLGVEPPTVTTMVTRLATHGLVVRQTSPMDGRLARDFLTDPGRALIADIDRQRKRLEKEALVGFDDKDKRRLRKLLRKMEKNLIKAGAGERDQAPPLDGDDLTAAEA